MNNRLNLKIFLVIVFLGGMVYQPNWVYENFWAKADFYSSLPFTFPFFLYLLIASSLQTAFIYFAIRLIKRVF